MQRIRQRVDQLIEALSPVETSWRDGHAESVIALLERVPSKQTYTSTDLQALLDSDFDAAWDLVRLFLDLSKDEFEMRLKEKLGSTGGIRIQRFQKNPESYLSALSEMGAVDQMIELVSRRVTWKDILQERLKSGRGSAIKGQARGRAMEDFVERHVCEVFGHRGTGYDARCRFVGESGRSTEKTDFAIPNKSHPQILIEAKAYGATGSKQTDILGDVSRIIEEKRLDTVFLFVTDGVTWANRKSDLQKLVEMQNKGRIGRIYTRSMEQEFVSDLRQLKEELEL